MTRAPPRASQTAAWRGRVAAADDADPLGAAELRLGRPGGVEDAEPLVVVEVVDRQAPVFGAGREQHRAGGDLVAVLEPDQVALVAGLERRGRGRGSPVRAPNLRAWVIARLVSSVPLIPAGKPR